MTGQRIFELEGRGLASEMTQQKGKRTIREHHEDHATKYRRDFAIKASRRGDIRSDLASEKLHCTTLYSTL